MCFQAIVADLACLTATLLGVTEYYLRILRFHPNARSSDFEVDEEILSWVGKERDLFYLHTQSGAIGLYDFYLI